jgi:hypothetical protein
MLELLDSVTYNERTYSTSEEISHTWANGSVHTLFINTIFKVDEDIMIQYYYLGEDLKTRVMTVDGEQVITKKVTVDIHTFHNIFTIASPE